jgi:hypothetical protein
VSLFCHTENVPCNVLKQPFKSDIAHFNALPSCSFFLYGFWNIFSLIFEFDYKSSSRFSLRAWF